MNLTYVILLAVKISESCILSIQFYAGQSFVLSILYLSTPPSPPKKNDLPLAVKDAEITLYADDTSLYKAFKNIKELNETLVPAFSNICDWLKCNKLSLNAIKSEFMIISTSQKIRILNRKLHHL